MKRHANSELHTKLKPGGHMIDQGVFFKPKRSFLQLLLDTPKFRYRRVIDVGAGVGHLSARLFALGFEIVPIDINVSVTQEYPVKVENGVTFYYDYQDLVIIARPCHNGFAHAVAVNAIEQGATVLYVSKAGNLAEDMTDLVTRELLRDAGEDGEVVYQVIGAPSQLKEYALVQLPFWDRPNWMMDKGSRYVQDNLLSGFPKGGDEKVLRTMKAECFEQLDYTEVLLDDKSDAGWVTPDGVWYGCKENDHIRVCTYIFGISVERAEKLGFVKASGDYRKDGNPPYSRADDKRLTPKQRKALEDHGYTLRHEGITEPLIDRSHRLKGRKEPRA